MNITITNPTTTVNGQVEKTMPTTTETHKANTEKANNTNRLKEETNKKQDNLLSVKDTKELATQMNEIMDDLQTSLGFSIREELNHQVVVEITDRKTNEVIKQIPSEELLTIKGKMEELTGLIFDQSV